MNTLRINSKPYHRDFAFEEESRRRVNQLLLQQQLCWGDAAIRLVLADAGAKVFLESCEATMLREKLFDQFRNDSEFGNSEKITKGVNGQTFYLWTGERFSMNDLLDRLPMSKWSRVPRDIVLQYNEDHDYSDMRYMR